MATKLVYVDSIYVATKLPVATNLVATGSFVAT